jgi:hypothetical protein
MVAPLPIRACEEGDKKKPNSIAGGQIYLQTNQSQRNPLDAT